MNGTSENQLVRWAIPGWTMLLVFLVFEIEYSFVANDTEPLKRILQLGVSNSIAGIVVATVSGIPLGYLIYQVYFFFRWNWWFSGTGLFYRRAPHWFRDRLSNFFLSPGRLDEIEYFLGGKTSAPIEMSSLLQGREWAHPLNLVSQGRHREKWALLENIWMDLNSPDGKDDHFWLQRNRYLFNILHGLGATRVAIALAYLSSVAFEVHITCSAIHSSCPLSWALTNWLTSTGALGLALPFITLVVLLMIVNANRNDVVTRLAFLWYYALGKSLAQSNEGQTSSEGQSQTGGCHDSPSTTPSRLPAVLKLQSLLFRIRGP